MKNHLVGNYFSKHNELEITQLLSNSQTFDYKKVIKTKADLIFIDADHSYMGVKKDTEKALDILSDKGTIIWHNYEDVGYPDVTLYLSKLSKKIKLFQLRNTMLVVYSRLNTF